MNGVDDSQRISALSLSFDAGHFVHIPRVTPTLFEITFLAGWPGGDETERGCFLRLRLRP
jgi:hypothetical protein